MEVASKLIDDLNELLDRSSNLNTEGSRIDPACLHTDNPVESALQHFLLMYGTFKNRAVSDFYKSPWNSHRITNAMQLLIGLHALLIPLSEFPAMLKTIKSQIILLINDQLSAVYKNLVNRPGCGICDISPVAVPFEYGDLSTASNHMIRNDGWVRLSRREKTRIVLDSIYFSFEKNFMHSFQMEIRELQIVLKELNSTCDCENSFTESQALNTAKSIQLLLLSPNGFGDDMVAISNELRVYRETNFFGL
jgi:hypothetical protein